MSDPETMLFVQYVYIGDGCPENFVATNGWSVTL